MKSNEPSVYKACYRSSTPNNLPKSELTSIFLLTMSSATLPSSAVFSLANLSTSD